MKLRDIRQKQRNILFPNEKTKEISEKRIPCIALERNRAKEGDTQTPQE